MDLNIQNKFTQDEKEVFSIIKNVIQKYAPSTKAFLVGGICRNLLIGLPSSDIDIMVYPTKAEDFAMLITKHLGLKGPHVIKENPEKSRYISTSKVYIPTSNGTQEVDIAQARQDVYGENSRIPETELATPEKDALRRDFTVNAIFYDLVENHIVDYTGNGIKDLIAKNLRTPQDPLKTFLDDPLRIFRGIRLSSQLGFSIDPETYQAMKDPSLREEIKRKVSKERLGIEFLKMMKGKNPQKAIQLLKDTGLFDDIMSEALKGTKYEGKMSPLDMDQNNTCHKLNLWSHTMQSVEHILGKYPEAEPEKRATMILSALMHDLGKLFQDIHGQSKTHPGSTSYHGHEDESKIIAEHILKYLKLEPMISQISLLVSFHMRPHQFTQQTSSIKALRKFIRECGEKSISWLDVLNLSISDAYSKDLNIDPETVKQYQELEQRLQEALVSLSPTKDTTKIKPILNGNEIMEILNIGPGAHMKQITEFVNELGDEGNITKEEAAIKIKERFQNPQPKQSEQQINTMASKNSTVPKFSTCSTYVIQQKMMDLQELLDEGKTREAISVMNSLRDTFGNDEKITRLIAINTFKSLLKDSNTRNNDLVQYIFDKATENFFDSVLNAYAFGILLVTKTSTDENVLREVGSRVLKMSPGTLRFVLDMLPQEQIVNHDAANFVKGQLNENYQRK